MRQSRSSRQPGDAQDCTQVKHLPITQPQISNIQNSHPQETMSCGQPAAGKRRAHSGTSHAVPGRVSRGQQGHGYNHMLLCAWSTQAQPSGRLLANLGKGIKVLKTREWLPRMPDSGYLPGVRGCSRRVPRGFSEVTSLRL